MNMNRRSVLIGLGAAGVGSGALFASGAFTSVEAERTVELNTSDDSDALLAFAPNNPDTFAENNVIGEDTAGGSSLISIEQSDLNENAVTRFEETLRVTNNGDKDVGLSIDGAESDDGGQLGDVLDVQESGTSIVDTPIDLAAGDDITLDIVIDLQGTNSGDDLDDISTVVFVADEGDYSST